jgi:PPM family protein phosphatase
MESLRLRDMNLEVWGQTDVGLKRDINQDSILTDKNLGLFIVADGMGGHRGGEVASSMAVEATQEVFENQQGSKTSPKDLIRSAFREASRRIFLKSTRQNPELMGMGTTMILAYAKEGRLYLGNVGDSRAYMWKEGNLWQMTEDHSLVNEQIKAGIISVHEAGSVVGKNVITRSVGFEQDVIVDILERELSPGEIYLLCSDGLSGMVSDQKLSSIFKSGDPQTIVEKCIAEAKKGGGDDNISVVVIKVLS